MIYSIYVFHYILFSAGLSAVIILCALFVQTYSDASLSEIGALLMALPFLSIIAKPLFCALADRQQAHKAYLIGSLLFMALGYGSMVVAPFFPEFVKEHGRLIWYLDVVGISIGFSAFGVAFSIGDALSVFAANKKGIPWGSYRVWATVSWGFFGCLIGQINETPLLPKYVPAFLVLVGALLFESLLLLVWPSHVFDMRISSDDSPDRLNSSDSNNDHSLTKEHDLELNELQSQWPCNKSMQGTLSGSTRFRPRLMGAMANVFIEDLGSSLRSSISGAAPKQRSTLAEVLEQHKLTSGGAPTFDAANPPMTPNLGRQSVAVHSQQQPVSAGNQAAPTTTTPPSSKVAQPAGAVGQHPVAQHPQLPRQASLAHLANSPGEQAGMSMGKAALLRTQRALSRMNSLSSASGHVIVNPIDPGDQFGSPQLTHRLMSGSANNAASLSRAAAARALELGQLNSSLSSSAISQKDSPSSQLSASVSATPANAATDASIKDQNEQYVEDLQMVLFKLIVRRNPSIIKYLILFTLIGILFTAHMAYFFIHVQQLCTEKGSDFSSVMGAFTVAHAVSEVIGFLFVVPYYMPWVGRFGSMMTPIIIFFARYLFYGTYYVEISPWFALVSEFGHGFGYAITYSLITEIATECVDDVDQYLPELIQRGVVPPTINPDALKLPLRATMYGVFSGAFDGLGNGIGSLLGGIYLDSHPFTALWLCCSYLAASVAVIYPLTEWRLFCGNSKDSVGGSKKL